MSKGQSEEVDWEAPPPQTEKLPVWKVFVGLFATIAIFAAAIVAAWLYLDGMRPQLNPRWDTLPDETKQAEINIVNQDVFVLDVRAYEEHDRIDQRLNSYGWVDRERGQIHIPIHQAIKEVLQQHARRHEEKRP